MDWLKGDLHTHSVYSDGTHTIEEKVKSARNVGLDFIALTDHHTMEPNNEITGQEPILVLPGIELGAMKRGHSNFIGCADPSPYPNGFEPQNVEDMRRGMQYAVSKGAFVSINHPFDEPGLCWEYGYDLPFHAVEIWNAPWRCINLYALQWWSAQLRAGARIPIVGGSDIHTNSDWMYHGTPTTVVGCKEPTKDAIIQSLKAGCCYIKESPQAVELSMHCGSAQLGEQASVSDGRDVEILLTQARPGDRLELHTAQGKVEEWTIEQSVLQMCYHAVPGDRFVRIEVWRRQAWQQRYPHMTNEMIELLQTPSLSMDEWLVLIGNPIYFNV